MIVSATGFILRTRPLTETSLIVHWLTADLGRVATVARGARRPKSPFAGKLDLFFECEFSFSRSRRSDLHTLREVSLRETHPSLRQDLAALRQAAYAVTFLEQTTETETPLPGARDLFAGWLNHLAAGAAPPLHVCGLELKLLAELGLAPDLNRTRLSPATRQLAERLSTRDWPELRDAIGAPAQVTELRQFLHGHLIYHLGRLPRGRAEALAG